MSNLKKSLMQIIGVIACSLIIIFISRAIYDSGFMQDKYGKDMQYLKGIVTKVVSEDLSEDPNVPGVEIGRQNIIVKLTEGQFKDEEHEMENPISRIYNYKVEEGTKVIIGCYYRGDEPIMAVYNYDRSSMLYTLIVLFIAVVVIIGGLKGVKSLVALIFTLVCCVFLMVPMLFRGVSPIIAGILVAILSITVTLTLVSGINKKTITAILGTIAGVIISGSIAYIFGNLTHLSGLTMTDSESLIYISESSGLQIRGIMFAGILVASLGAVMDVAMSISSSIFEMNDVNSKMTFNQLFRSAMNIGKDIIGTMTNTLILAFAGGSLSTLILIFASQMPYNKMINLDVLGIEVIQGLAGSIGIVLAVPITAFIGSYLCKVYDNKYKIKEQGTVNKYNNKNKRKK